MGDEGAGMILISYSLIAYHVGEHDSGQFAHLASPGCIYVYNPTSAIS